MTRHALTASWLACLSLLAAAAAVAQEPTALSWVRAPGAEACIPAQELGRRVEALVGPVLVPAPEGRVSVEGRVEPAGRGFTAHVVVSGAHGEMLGERTLHSDEQDCRALDDRLSFVIAVAIDPDAAVAELPAELSPLPGEDPGAELLAELEQAPDAPARRTAPSPAAKPAPAAPRKTRGDHAAPAPLAYSLWVHAGAVAGTGKARELAPGLQAGGQLWLPELWPLRVQARYWLQADRAIDEALPTAVELRALTLVLSICPLARVSGALRLQACTGPAVERLHAAPLGFSGRAQTRWLLGGALQAGVALRLIGPLWIALEGSAEALWPKHEIVYELAGDPVQVFSVPAASAALSLGVEARF